jgi:hypothetical protein
LVFMGIDRAHSIRRAFALSPAVSLLMFWAGLLTLSSVHEATPLSMAAAGHTLFFVALFGLPAVYAGAFLVGAPLWWLLEAMDRQTPLWVIGLSTLAGAAIALVVWRFMFGDWDTSGMIAGLGAVSALIGSLAFVRLANLSAPRPAP